MPNFDFTRFCAEGIAYGKINGEFFQNNYNYPIHKRIFATNNSVLAFGTKSYIENVSIYGAGLIQIGNFSSISWNIIFEMMGIDDHNYHNISSYAFSHLDWAITKDFYPKHKNATLNLIIGSDVWIGIGCHVKVSNQDKPIIIGNGAIVAADSVVVKNVPPYAIVGGNPAKFIKWRFDPEIIEALERIAWWNWDLEKIYDNFQLFNNPKEFVKKFDPQYNE